MIITELELETFDLGLTGAFYREVLGLELLSSSAERLIFRVGETRLIFRHRPGFQSCYHFALEIPHNKLLEAYQWMREKVPVLPIRDDMPFSHFLEWNAQSFYFFDPAGNLLELICRYDLPNSSRAPFLSNAFLRISEVGIVSTDIPSLVDQVGSAYGIMPYPKQNATPDFAALGDDSGLLIVVKPGRHWFPTRQAAERSFVRVVVAKEGSHGAVELVFT